MNSRQSVGFVAVSFVLAGVCVPAATALGQMTPAPVLAAGASPASQPSADTVQGLIDARQYQAAVKTASKLLAMHGPAAADLDRFDLTMLKGYAQAGMHSNSSAVMTFRAAEKETKDPNQLALAKWTSELFHTAGSSTFKPKTAPLGAPKPGPFDLLNSDKRKQAFGALLDDNLTLLDPKLKAATISQNLNQIWPVLQQVMDLDNLDVIANGNDDKTQQLASSLLDHSRNLLSNALKEDWARVSDIDTHANITNTVPTQLYVNNTLVTQTITKKNGLSDNNKSELNNIIQTCQKIHDAANAFMSLAKSDSGWTTILSDSDRVASRASDVLNADYGQAVSSSSSTDSGFSGYQQTGVLNQFPGGYTNTTPAIPPKRSNVPTKPKTGTGS
jgi:uncharacterized phage infection (PIP) family protein YhgE